MQEKNSHSNFTESFTEKVDLLPCPYCGGTNIYTETTITERVVRCTQCRAGIVHDVDAIPPESTWNNRVVNEIVKEYSAHEPVWRQPSDFTEVTGFVDRHLQRNVEKFAKAEAFDKLKTQVEKLTAVAEMDEPKRTQLIESYFADYFNLNAKAEAFDRIKTHAKDVLEVPVVGDDVSCVNNLLTELSNRRKLDLDLACKAVADQQQPKAKKCGQDGYLCPCCDHNEFRPQPDTADEPAQADVREKLAEYAHQAWSGWMFYLFGLSAQRNDGAIIVPATLAKRWRRQAATFYQDLPENEKDSDRLEADRMLAIIYPHRKTESEPGRYLDRNDRWFRSDNVTDFMMFGNNCIKCLKCNEKRFFERDITQDDATEWTANHKCKAESPRT